jgi:hypothetical protein
MRWIALSNAPARSASGIRLSVTWRDGKLGDDRHAVMPSEKPARAHDGYLVGPVMGPATETEDSQDDLIAQFIMSKIVGVRA